MISYNNIIKIYQSTSFYTSYYFFSRKDSIYLVVSFFINSTLHTVIIFIHFQMYFQQSIFSHKALNIIICNIQFKITYYNASLHLFFFCLCYLTRNIFLIFLLCNILLCRFCLVLSHIVLLILIFLILSSQFSMHTNDFYFATSSFQSKFAQSTS